MVELKVLSPEFVPSALEMAKRYRLLNEPQEAESICLDILAVVPDHQEALITLLLALTDNFAYGLNPSYQKAMEAAELLNDQYCHAYYTGIIYERRAKAHLRQGGPGSGTVAHSWLTKALESFDQAMKSCDPDNQDAVLRWNSCARIINTHPDVKPGDTDRREMLMDSFDTPH
jgi:hypothetical protein